MSNHTTVCVEGVKLIWMIDDWSGSTTTPTEAAESSHFGRSAAECCPQSTTTCRSSEKCHPTTSETDQCWIIDEH